MVELLLGIIFLLIVGAIAFLLTYWLPILLGILTVAIIWITIYSIYFNALKKRLDRVVKAYLVSRQPITKREKEVIGYEENAYYYPYRHSEIFRYVDVIVGYRVKFSLVYEDGERDTITCKEGSYAYRKLIAIQKENKKSDHYGVTDLAQEIKTAMHISPTPPSRVDLPSKNENSVAQKSVCLETVRKNLSVDEEVFHRYGIVFKCNLVKENNTLQLNFEASNASQYIAKVKKGTDLTIRANVYDEKGNLLCIEEEWADYSGLRRGYVANYIYFTSNSISDAHSMKVYAIDPSEDYDDADEVVFEAETPKAFASPVESKQQEKIEEAPALDYDAVYTYCQVALNENGRTYSYRTNSPDFKVGDEVYVPVGYKNQEKIGKIVSMADYVGRDAPYPLEKTKIIIGKVEITKE